MSAAIVSFPPTLPCRLTPSETLDLATWWHERFGQVHVVHDRCADDEGIPGHDVVWLTFKGAPAPYTLLVRPDRRRFLALGPDCREIGKARTLRDALGLLLAPAD